MNSALPFASGSAMNPSPPPRHLRSTTLTALLGVALLAALLAASLAGVGAALAAPPAADGSPMARIKQTNDRVSRILKSKSGDTATARTEMQGIVDGLIDYDEVARRALAQHWEPLSAAQRKEFVATLRELIEKNYEKQLRTRLDYAVAYRGEQIDNEQATVATTVKVHTKGKSTETNIDYRLRKDGARWMVWDVITDDVSMVRNYRDQFNKIIAKESFDGLLKKMRKRIADLDHPDADSNAPQK